MYFSVLLVKVSGGRRTVVVLLEAQGNERVVWVPMEEELQS